MKVCVCVSVFVRVFVCECVQVGMKVFGCAYFHNYNVYCM